MTGCCATAPRRFRPAVSSVGPRGSGRRAASCMRRVAVSASTGRFLRSPSRAGQFASSVTPGNSIPAGVSYRRTASRKRARSPWRASSGIDARRFVSGPASDDVRVHHSSNEPARNGVGSSSTTTSSSSASVRRTRDGRGVVERERAGNARRRYRRAELFAHGVEHHCEPRVRARAPQTAMATRPPGRSTRRISLVRRGIEGEHQAFATQHDVVGGVGLVDLFEIELPRAHVRQFECTSARGGDCRHLGYDVGQHDVATRRNELGRSQSGAAGTTRELEHTFARPRSRPFEHLHRDQPARASTYSACSRQDPATLAHIPWR